MDSSALKRHARCERCAKSDHINTYPTSRIHHPDVRGMRHVTPIHVPTDAEKEFTRHALQLHKDEMWSNAWDRWQNSLPEKFRNATVSDPRLGERISRIKLNQAAVSSAIIVGDVGRGKTWEAVGFANELIRLRILHPSEVLFGTEAGLLSSIANASYGEVGVGLKRLTSGRYRMIIIDDVGHGGWLRPDMRPNVFFLLIDALWGSNDIMVITTNMQKDDLSAYIGRPAYERLRSMAGLESVKVHGEDRRASMARAALRKIPPEK